MELERGKIYDGFVDTEHGVESLSIIPLTKSKDGKSQFILINARKLYQEDPELVKAIIKMTWDNIINDGIKSVNYDFDSMTIICTINQDGTLTDVGNNLLFNFKESEFQIK